MAAPYFEAYVDFALQDGEESGAYFFVVRFCLIGIGCLDQRLMDELEQVRPAFGGRCDTITTALLKEYRGVADCVRELHRTRPKLMQTMRKEEVRARTKISTHRRYFKRGHTPTYGRTRSLKGLPVPHYQVMLTPDYAGLPPERYRTT